MDKINTLPAVRSLTRGELKAIRKNNLDPAINTEDRIVGIKLSDYILDVVFADTDFTDIPNNVCEQFVRDVYKATFGSVEDEKN